MSNNTTYTSLMVDDTACCTVGSTVEFLFLTLGVLAVLFVILSIYRKILIRNQLRLAAGQGSDNQLNHQQLKNGLDPSAITALPCFNYEPNTEDCSSGNQNKGKLIECAVCLSFIEQGEMVRQLPECQHMFHVQCIDVWLSSNSTCPLCRADVVGSRKSVAFGKSDDVEAVSTVVGETSISAMDRV